MNNTALSKEDHAAIFVELLDKLSRRTESSEPMRTFYAVQQKTHEKWEIKKLFYTVEFAQAYIDRTTGNFRIEQVEREIND